MKMHVLARTETGEMLSARYGVPVCMIIRANHLGAEDRLFAGRKIQIPPVDYCWKAEETSGAGEAESGKQAYQVRPGDTVYSIAQRFHTTMNAILLENGLARPEELRAGMRISVPCFPENFAVYSLTSMDTLEGVAEKFGVTVTALRGANDLPDTLYPGLQLVIPGKREGI